MLYYALMVDPINQGRWRLIKKLLNRGCEYYEDDDDKESGLSITARYGQWELFDLFLKKGCNMFDTGIPEIDLDSIEGADRGKTPLWLAARKWYP